MILINQILYNRKQVQSVNNNSEISAGLWTGTRTRILSNTKPEILISRPRILELLYNKFAVWLLRHCQKPLKDHNTLYVVLENRYVVTEAHHIDHACKTGQCWRLLALRPGQPFYRRDKIASHKHVSHSRRRRPEISVSICVILIVKF